ncbi:MAG TPA: tRNA threonylcarbamoyladenosine dehydratase [Anaerovoracaceae bacterium]|nr:tRNA threonylcarbamoyladenosine dehydratase [Anaerovoracaceae bacterium]
MSSQFERTELLIGAEGTAKLAKSRIAVFGIGGVGGYVVEALARSGVGYFDLFDGDVISLTNLNRQIIATHKTLGKYKVDAAKERIADINPNAEVRAHKVFYTVENAREVDLTFYDYIIDAIDTVSSKIELIVRAKAAGKPIISSMGAGNKMDPTVFMIDDIYNTSVCPLAKVMRRELRKRNIKNLKVVYSKEMPLTTISVQQESGNRVPGSNAFVPPAAGLVIASEVFRDLIYRAKE